MYSESLIIEKINSNKNTENDNLSLEDYIMNAKLRQQEVLAKNDMEIDRLADRALLLLSFKDTPTQNLQTVLHVLGIETLEEKKSILQEIFRLIREGIVYIPRGLPQLIENGLNFEESKDIDLRLLCPYDHLIQEIQDQITKLQAKNGI
ncbi:MAG: hypothetical protein ACFE95_22965 [Candidatus Hodarchaeota archaeon]